MTLQGNLAGGFGSQETCPPSVCQPLVASRQWHLRALELLSQEAARAAQANALAALARPARPGRPPGRARGERVAW